MNLLEKFNSYYSTETKRHYEKSLLDFFHKDIAHRLPARELSILDIGPGSKSIFEDIQIPNSTIQAIDFSPVAIEKALSASSGISYQCADVSAENVLAKNTYDLIFDSHCLHCIKDKDQRSSAFKNIYEALKDDGIWTAELMISAANRAQLPFKYVVSAMELEEEILRHGFKIKYFMVVKNISFVSENGECDLVRVIAQK